MLNKLLIIYLLFFGNFLFTILKAEDKTFSYTGSVQTWTVPTGVSSIEVDGYGGMGGHGSSSWNGRGGFGGRLEATISVTAGDTINIYVGEKLGDQTHVPSLCIPLRKHHTGCNSLHLIHFNG